MGIVQILREGAVQAKQIADGLGAARTEAEALSRIQAAPPQPATFAPPTGSPTSPSGPPPGGGAVLGPDGRPISGAGGGRGATTSSTGGGGGSAGGGTSGGADGGGGRSRTADEVLLSIDGQRRASRAWIQESGLCRLVKLSVPARGFTGALSNEVTAWDCGEFGTYIDEPGVLSATSGGGGGSGVGPTPAPKITTRNPYGYANTEIPLNPPAPYGRQSGGSQGSSTSPTSPVSAAGSSRSGPQQVTGDVRVPEVAAAQQETNRLLRNIASGDGGTGLRAGGLI